MKQAPPIRRNVRSLRKALGFPTADVRTVGSGREWMVRIATDIRSGWFGEVGTDCASGNGQPSQGSKEEWRARCLNERDHLHDCVSLAGGLGKQIGRREVEREISLGKGDGHPVNCSLLKSLIGPWRGLPSAHLFAIVECVRTPTKLRASGGEGGFSGAAGRGLANHVRPHRKQSVQCKQTRQSRPARGAEAKSMSAVL